VSGLGVFKIAGKETEAGIVSGVAYQQFALLIRAHRFACIIDDAHLDIVLFLAEATGSDKAWLAVGNDDGARACFGHGPGLEQGNARSEEHTSELQSREKLVCRPLLEKKKTADRTAPPDQH